MRNVRIAAGALWVACLGAPAVAAPDIETLERSLVRVVVTLEDGAGTGTGFVLNANGQIATNQHVVANQKRLAVYFSGENRVHNARLVWFSTELDLAVIQVRSERRSAMSLAESLPKKGALVYALGFPGDSDILSTHGVALDATVTQGVLSRVFTGAWHRLRLTLLQHSAGINPGNSGGPLLDDCGRVIGVNTAGPDAKVEDADGNVRRVPTASGISWASSAAELRKALDRHSISYTLDASACATGAPASGSSPGAPSETAWGRWAGLLAATALAIALFGSVWRRRSASQPAGNPRPAHRVQAPTGAVAPAGPAQPLDADLVLTGSDASGSSVRISLSASQLKAMPHGLIIGRHPQLADVVISSSGVSRRHLRVAWANGHFTAEDLNSANGSKRNGQPMKPCRPQALRPGDRFALGDLELQAAEP